MKVRQITVREYIDAEDRSIHEHYFDYINADLSLNNQAVSFFNLSFDQVSVIKRLIVKNTFEAYNSITNILFNESIDMYEQGLFDFISYKKAVEEEIVKLYEKEKNLPLLIDPKNPNAGEELKQFAEWNTKIDLAEQFKKDPEEIGAWKYRTVFIIKHRNLIKLKNQMNGRS